MSVNLERRSDERTQEILPDAREQLRQRYRPQRVRMLFIGESPPASGRFFYQADSGLYRAFRDVFALADPTINDGNFLKRFQRRGCYLIDLCARPVDDLAPKQRRAACRRGEAALAESIRQLRPQILVILLRSIQPNVRRALQSAGWSGDVIEVPYPGRWKRHRQKFTEILLPVLQRLSLT